MGTVTGTKSGTKMDLICTRSAPIPYPTALLIIPARNNGPTGAKKDPSRWIIDGRVIPSRRYGWNAFVGTFIRPNKRTSFDDSFVSLFDCAFESSNVLATLHIL